MLKKYLILILSFFLFALGGAQYAQAASYIYGAIALTGGTSGALDEIDGDDLSDDDMAIVITSNSFYLYHLNASSGAAESSPDVISPDSNAGNKRWILVGQGDAETAEIAQLTPTDGNFIVGNDSTWVAESGATARTSMGVGSGDSPTFATPVVTSLNTGQGANELYAMDQDVQTSDKPTFAGNNITADSDYNKNYIQQLQNIADHKGASYWFDGLNDDIVKTDDSLLDFGTDGDFSIEMVIKPDDVTRTTDYLINKEDGGVGWGLYLNEDDLYIRLDDNNTDASAVIGTAQFSDYVWAHVFVVFDRSGNAIAYINGESVGTVDISGVSNTISNAGNLHIANDSADGNEYKGEIAVTKAYNRTFTAAEVEQFYSKALLAFKYSGKTNAYDSDFSAGADSWTTTNGAYGAVAGNIDGIDGEDDTLRFTAVAAYGSYRGIYTTVAARNEKHKSRYITFKYYIPSTNSEIDGVRFMSTNLTEFYTDIQTVTDAWTTVKAQYTTTGSAYVVFAGYDGSARNYTEVGGDDVFYITDINIDQLGCVLDYNPSGMGENQVQDNSGNELAGTVSGVVLINRPVNHQEKYLDLSVTGDTSFTLPEGYVISYIVLTSDGAIGGGIDIGTTDGGGEVVTAEAISGAVTVLCTLVAGANYNTTGADDTIYITDADGTGWDGATVEVRVQMQRLDLGG